MIWIWNKYKDWFTDGTYKITREVIEYFEWNKLRDIYYSDTGRELPLQKFDLPKRIEPVWVPLSLEEIKALLNE